MPAVVTYFLQTEILLIIYIFPYTKHADTHTLVRILITHSTSNQVQVRVTFSKERYETIESVSIYTLLLLSVRSLWLLFVVRIKIIRSKFGKRIMKWVRWGRETDDGIVRKQFWFTLNDIVNERENGKCNVGCVAYSSVLYTYYGLFSWDSCNQEPVKYYNLKAKLCYMWFIILKV